MKRFFIALIVALAAINAQAEAGKVEMLWLGQSAFKITTPTGMPAGVGGRASLT